MSGYAYPKEIVEVAKLRAREIFKEYATAKMSFEELLTRAYLQALEDSALATMVKEHRQKD